MNPTERYAAQPIGWLVFLVLGCVVLSGTSLVEGQSSQAQSLEDWQSDLEYLRTELPKRHVAPFAHQSKESFESRAAAARIELKGLPSHLRVFSLAKTVGSVGDGHTALAIDFSRLHYFPFNAHWFDDGVYITAATEQHKEILQAKILKIGQRTMEQIVEDLKPVIAHDNPFGLRKVVDKQLNTAELLQYIGAIQDFKGADFEFEKDGKRFQLKLNSMGLNQARRIKWIPSSQTPPLYATKGSMDFWNDWVRKEQILYFKYNRCRNQEAFDQLVRGTKGFVEQNEVKTFVLDLRNNVGGNSLVFKSLYTFLKDHPTLDKKGRLFVIIGRGTFSSGLFAAADMQKTNAIFVGEPTGGNLNHFGEVKSFALPKSKLNVFYSTREFKLNAGGKHQPMVPEIRVPFRSADFFSGKDPAMQAIADY